MLVTLNGVIQSPGTAYQIVGNQIVFAEPPRPDSKVVYRNVDIQILQITRLNLNTIGGIFPSIGDFVSGFTSNASARVVATGATSIDVIDITGGPFQNNERIDVNRTGFSALIGSFAPINQDTIFEFAETVTKVALSAETAKIEETNLDLDGNIDSSLVLSKTSGTAEFETGVYNILLNDFIYSSASNIAAKIVSISPYRDPISSIQLTNGSAFLEGDQVTGGNSGAIAEVVRVDDSLNPPVLYFVAKSVAEFISGETITAGAINDVVSGDITRGDVVDTLIINKGSSFFGLVFERLISLSNQNIILDNIAETTITPTTLTNAADRINADFLDYEEVRSTEIEYNNLSGGALANDDVMRSVNVTYGNTTDDALNRYKDAARSIRNNKQEIIDYATSQIAIDYPDFYYTGEAETAPWGRFRDGYRLIQKNKAWIVAKAYQDMVVQYPGSTIPSATKCKRDIGYMIDALSRDTGWGGTVYTRKFIQKYFSADGLTYLYVNAQSNETVYAYEQAYGYMQNAIQNDLTGSETIDAVAYTKYNERTTGPNNNTGITADPNPGGNYGSTGTNTTNNGTDNCADVQAALQTLFNNVKEVLNAGSLTDLIDLSLPDANYTAKEIKCNRDTGYFVDAIADDLDGDGNFAIVTFTKKFFDANGIPINNGLPETEEAITAFNAAKDLCKRAMRNLLYSQTLTTKGYNLNDPTTYSAPFLDGGGGTTAHYYDPNYASGSNQLDTNCANVASAIDTLSNLATTAFTGAQFTASNATYNAATGVMVLTIGTHSLTTADTVRIDANSLTFTCLMDGNTAQKTYPRSTDPAYETQRAITATTNNTITINVGTSPLVNHDVTGANYNVTSGDLQLTIGAHNLEVGTSIKIATESLTFQCAYNGGGTSVYPRASGANTSSGADYAYDTALPITSKTGTTITVNVNGGQGAISNTDAHTFVSATSGAVISGGNYTHTFVSGTTNGIKAGGNLDNINALSVISDGTYRENENIRVNKYAYKDRGGSGFFVPGNTIIGAKSGASFELKGANSGLKWLYAQTVSGILENREYITNTKMVNNLGGGNVNMTPTNAAYDPLTGQLTLTKTAHGYSVGNKISLANNCLTFSCDMDGGNASKTYPRTTDPVGQGQQLDIIRTTADTFTVVVGASPIVEKNITGANYDPVLGEMQINVEGGHNLNVGESIRLKPNSLTFTCDTDGNATEHSYPRAAGAGNPSGGADPAYNTAVAITAVGFNTYTVTDATYTPLDGSLVLSIVNHGMQSGNKIKIVDGSIRFTCAKDNNATNHDYPRTTDPISYQWYDITVLDDNNIGVNVGVSSDTSVHTYVSANSNGVQKQNGDIYINVLGGSAPASDTSPHTFVRATEGALMTGGGYTHQFVSAVTNGVTVYPASVRLTNTQKRAGTKSLAFDSGAYLSYGLSDITAWGTSDFTIEFWIRPTTPMNTQKYLLDLRTSGATETNSWSLYIDSGNLKWKLNQTDQISGAHGMSPNVWYHVALTRTSQILKLWVNGSQVGSDYTDAATYYERKMTIGAEWNGQNNFVGFMDNFVIYPTSSKYTATFTPPTIFPTSTTDISFSMDNELPLIMSNQEAYATYTGTTNSAAQATSIDYVNREVIVEEIEISRDTQRACADILELNRGWIAETAVNKMKAKYPDLLMPGDTADGVGPQLGTNFCLRDTKEFILKGVIEDLRYGGNYNSTLAARNYLTAYEGLEHIANEVLMSIYTYRLLAPICNYVLTTTSTDLKTYDGTKYTEILRIPNNFSSPASQSIQDEITQLCDDIGDVIGPTGQRYRDAGDLLWLNRDVIAAEAVGWLEATYQANINGTTYDFYQNPNANPNKCSYEIKQYIIPAVIADLVTGGTSAMQYNASKFLNNNNELYSVDNELSAVIDAYKFVKMLCEKAVNNTLLTNGVASGGLGIPSAYQDDYYTMQYTTLTVYRDPTITIDPEGYDPSRTANDRLLDTAELLEKNANVIAWEAVHTMNDLSKFLNFTVPGGAQNCVDDVVDIIGAVGHDLRKGGNSKTYEAAKLYLDSETNNLIQLNGRQHTHQFVRAELNAIITGGSYNHTFVSSSTNAVTANGGAQFTPSNVVYQPATGNLILTIPSHGLTTSNTITIAENGFTFTCGMDQDESNHTYPRKGDPAYGKSIAITGYTLSTITVNVGASPLVNYNVSQASYDATNGELILSIGAHQLAVGKSFRFKQESLVFTCDRDDYATEHAYPRSTDPSFNTAVDITAVGMTSHTPTSAAYNPSTGVMTLTLNGHDLAGETTHTATDAAYNPETGILTLTVGNHGFASGDSVMLADNSVTFTCTLDGNTTNHPYPRSTDPASGSWLPIRNVTQNTFDVQVLETIPSTNVTAHTFVSATTNGITKANDYVWIEEDAVVFTCGEDGNGSNHAYPRPQDPAYKAWLPVTYIDANNFSVQTLSTAPSTNTTPHVYVSFATDGLKKQTGTITCNVGVAPGEDAAGISVIKIATEIAQLTMRNAFGRENLYIYNPDAGTGDDGGITGGGSESIDNVDVSSYERNAVKDRFINAADVIDRNIRVIAEETIAAAKAQYPSLQIPGGNINCVHDLTDFLYAIQWNLRHGGNNKVFHAAEYYVNEGLTHATEATWIMNYARDLAIQVMRNESLALNYGADPSYDTAIDIVDIASTSHTATNAAYDASTGLLTLTISGHGFDVGNRINIADNSLTLTCSMDNQRSNHVYPRSTDPVSGQWLPIISKTNDTFVVNVGTSRLIKFTPTQVIYEPNTGNLILTIGPHKLTTGTNIKILGNSLTFTCTQDANSTNHTYPRTTDPIYDEPVAIVGTTANTVTVNVGTSVIKNYDIHGANFNHTTGNIVLSVGPHDFRTGQSVKLATSSLVFRCDEDSYATDHVYPRASAPNGPDPAWNTSINIDAVGYTQHTPTNATYNSSTGVVQLTLANHGLTGHTTHTPTNAVFTPADGKMVVTLANHGFANNDRVKLAIGAITFTCALDNNATLHPYPRQYGSNAPGGSDYAFDKWIQVTNVTQDTFEINVGISSNTTTHTFVSALTNGLTHAGDMVKVAENALTFTCTKDGNSANKSYPRTSDPSYDEWLPVTKIDNNTISIVVGDSGPNDQYTHSFVSFASNGLWKQDGTITLDVNDGSGAISNQTNHVFQYAVSGALITGGNYTHTFKSATAGAVQTGGNYTHEFVSATANGIKRQDPAGNVTLQVGTSGPNDQYTHAFVSANSGALITGGNYQHKFVTAESQALITGGNYLHTFVSAATNAVSVGGSPTNLTPNGATYDGETGKLVLSFASAHNLTNSNTITIADNGLNFSCTFDGNSTVHGYPRSTDYASGQTLQVTEWTTNTITVNVTTTPIVNYDVSNATYDAGTGHLVLDIGTVGVAALKGPTAGLTATGASYDPSTGVMTLTVTGHNMANGDRVNIADNSLTFTCTQGSGNHSYPRSSDPASGNWLDISNVTTNTFDVQVLENIPSTNTTTHTFVSATTGGITKAGENVRVRTDSLTFTCSQDDYATTHTYPRAKDPAFDRPVPIVAKSGSTITVDVGQSPIVTYTPTNATYDPATGFLVLTIGAHSLVNGTTAKLAPNSLTFTCSRDGNTAQKTYPRSGHKFKQSFYNDLDYFPYNKGDYIITADTESPLCADVASAITTMMAIVTDSIATPASLTDGTITKTLPTIWPVKYAPEMVERDVSITYYADAGDNWNQTCPNSAAAIESLMNIVVDTIKLAKDGGGSHLDAIEKVEPWTFNRQYQTWTCYNVKSTIHTLFDVLMKTLSGGSKSDLKSARHILFNKHAIIARSFERTTNQYPNTAITADFASEIVHALLYDLNTGGNQGMLKLVNSWFDGEGNFIAFQDVVRQHLLFYTTRIREYVKRALYDQNNTTQWDGYDIYKDTTNTAAIDSRFEYEWESTEFRIDSSINLAYHGLNRSAPPSNNQVTFINSTDATNLQNLYDEGEDYNTDPELVLLTPTIEVGFERRESVVRITRPNFFSRGDIVAYIPASGQIEPALQDQSYYYVLNATAEWFEIAREIRHDARYRLFELDRNLTGQQRLQTVVRQGIIVPTATYPMRDLDQPISAGFNTADILIGATSNATSEVIRIRNNEADIIKLYYKYNIDAATGRFTNGETIQQQGSTSNNAVVVQTSVLSGDGTDEGWIYVESLNGALSDNAVMEGVTSGLTASINGTPTTRMLINLNKGQFATGEKVFNKSNAAVADIVSYENSSGALVGNTGGRITIDIETIQEDFTDGDIIYGSITDTILDIANITAGGFEQIELNQYVHAVSSIELDISSVVRDGGYNGDFSAGDVVYLLQGTIIKEPGFTAVVTQYQAPDPSANPPVPHKMWIANLLPYGTDSEGNQVTPDAAAQLVGQGTAIGKFENLNNFPIILAEANGVTETNVEGYGKVSGLYQSGVTGRIWLEDVVGTFPTNLTIISDYDWSAGVTQSKQLLGRCNRFFRGFDGTQTSFKLTINNGEAYFPDPAGHLLTFVNGILQPPGANFAYTAFSDQIQFTEAPTIGSEFIGYYVGKLRQLDDISFEFDSLRSSFNLRYAGGFYSLTLTEGVSSSTILPENNIICSLNGVIQEPGVGYELVGSRIIFAEVPRAGSTFVAFSYIGSDADVIAATIVPPVEAGDLLQIEGENDDREVALIESSNSLITFEYTGTVKGRNAEALSSITTGEIKTAIITSPGDGYTSRPNVDVISSSGFDGRVRALMGLLRVDVKTAGVGYSSPEVTVENVVEDDWVSPTGPAVNQGFDTYAGEGTDNEGNPIVIVPGFIRITTQPVNVTVNQGQTAGFTVISEFVKASDGTVGTTPLNYQWQRKQYGETNWANITGATAALYSSASAEQADDGDEFRVAITAAGASPIYSNSVILTVQTGATIISNFLPTQLFQ